MREYLYVFTLGLRNSIIYKIDFFSKLFLSFIPIFLYIFIWKSLYESNNITSIKGYTYNQMVLYLIFSIYITRFLKSYSQYQITNDIRDGGINKYFVKPINHMMYFMFYELGDKFLKLLILFVPIFYLKIIHDIYIGDSFYVCLVVNVYFMSYVLTFLIFYILSLLAFYFTEVGKIFVAVDLIIVFFSGGIIPIDFFGERMVEVLSYLPFYYLIYFPLDIVIKEYSYINILIGLTIQIFWILIFFIISKFLWNRGKSKYSAFGG